MYGILTEFSGLKKAPDLSAWKAIVDAQTHKPQKTVVIGLIAKYMDNEDTYFSVIEALKAAAWQEKVGLNVRWINSEKANESDFKSVDGLLVPGGFGARGVEGKI